MDSTLSSRNLIRTRRQADGRAAPKGQQPKAAIVDKALQTAAPAGLEGISIGALAAATGMSK